MHLLDKAFLLPYKLKIEKKIKKYLSSFEDDTTLSKAIAYSLTGEGKRFRPLIVLFVAENFGCYDVMDAALSVEFFHTASLIADDLPCMDNDDMRRGRPSLHKVYGEDVALLTSYTLIAAGYESLCTASSFHAQNGPLLCKRAIELVSTRAGLDGATGGQFLDLYAKDPDEKLLQKITYGKTVTLFEISFGLGHIFGKGSLDHLETTLLAAKHLGYAFQIADDLQDIDQDTRSLATILGKEKSLTKYQEHRDAFGTYSKEANISHQGFEKLLTILDALAGI